MPAAWPAAGSRAPRTPACTSRIDAVRRRPPRMPPARVATPSPDVSSLDPDSLDGVAIVLEQGRDALGAEEMAQPDRDERAAPREVRLDLREPLDIARVEHRRLRPRDDQQRLHHPRVAS